MTTISKYLRDVEITSDKSRMELKVIHEFLTNIYWSRGISREMVERGMENSLCVGAFHSGRQIGFVRVITDYTSFAYLCDVFVLSDYRKQGIAQAMVKSLIEHPDLMGLRRWVLATKDAQELYRKLGFSEPDSSRLFMQIHKPNVYGRPTASA